jgi:hypothetical protein
MECHGIFRPSFASQSILILREKRGDSRIACPLVLAFMAPDAVAVPGGSLWICSIGIF